MKTLIVVLAFVVGLAVTHRAVACDMGAIESVVRAACPGEGCASKPAPQQAAKECAGGCGQSSTPASTVGCVGKDCVTDASATSGPTALACAGSGC